MFTTYGEPVRREFADMWASMSIKPERQHAIENAARQVFANKDRYEKVEQETGVPWWWIGITHRLEAGGNFEKHLHNGDPLSARTQRVPKGRPKVGKPPFKWEASAKDALLSHGLEKVEEWTLPRAAYEFERYNGFGYRSPGKPASPYLWSFTDHYTKGKFVDDGKYSANAVSQQCGTMPVLAELMKIDPSVCPDLDGLKDEEQFPRASTPGPPPPASIAQSTEAQAATATATVGSTGASLELGNAMGRAMQDGHWSLMEFAGQVASSGWFWGCVIVTLTGVYGVLRRWKRLKQWGQ